MNDLLLSMKRFVREFPDGPIAQQPVAQLPWGQMICFIQNAEIEAELAGELVASKPDSESESPSKVHAKTRRRKAGKKCQ